MQNLTLIRGLPGSGKSTVAAGMSESSGAIHLESDMYFINDEGEYIFDPEKLEDAHHWCLEQTRKYLRMGIPVIVSNTFTRCWEMQKYVDLEPYCVSDPRLKPEGLFS